MAFRRAVSCRKFCRKLRLLVPEIETCHSCPQRVTLARVYRFPLFIIDEVHDNLALLQCPSVMSSIPVLVLHEHFDFLTCLHRICPVGAMPSCIGACREKSEAAKRPKRSWHIHRALRPVAFVLLQESERPTPANLRRAPAAAASPAPTPSATATAAARRASSPPSLHGPGAVRTDGAEGTG
jgi:hypothetical protein